jgi:hypothetical protein
VERLGRQWVARLASGGRRLAAKYRKGRVRERERERERGRQRICWEGVFENFGEKEWVRSDDTRRLACFRSLRFFFFFLKKKCHRQKSRTIV